MFLGVMAMSDFLDGKAGTHLVAAYWLFRRHHESVCPCGKGQVCEKFCPFSVYSPELPLFSRLLKELGMGNGIHDTLKPKRPWEIEPFMDESWNGAKDQQSIKKQFPQDFAVCV